MRSTIVETRISKLATLLFFSNSIFTKFLLDYFHDYCYQKQLFILNYSRYSERLLKGSVDIS